jgi:hypothetical protein
MNEYWGLLAQIGLWGWITAVIFFIHYSFPAVNQFIKREAFRWGLISLLFFACWITGMVLA